MAKRVGIREATKSAFRMAAAMVGNADFASLFDEEINERADAQENGDEILQAAQHAVYSKLMKMSGERHD